MLPGRPYIPRKFEGIGKNGVKTAQGLDCNVNLSVDRRRLNSLIRDLHTRHPRTKKDPVRNPEEKNLCVRGLRSR